MARRFAINEEGLAGKDNKMWLSGNQAIALGAYEAGVKVASGYPGTPSTEIMQSLSDFDGVYAEWAPNEKVALEVAIGASFAGVRSLAVMKHVGLNVASDPLFAASYTGVRGGLVVITADDPEMHSSQNEQDNRNYALAAKMPLLEPSDPAEAREMIRFAFEFSEKFDTPVLFRITTRLAHVKGVVARDEVSPPPSKPSIVRNPEKFILIPATSRQRRIDLDHRQAALADYASEISFNRIEWGDRKKGIITSGVSYLYVKEAFPDASVLKLGMSYPFPEKLVRDFAAEIDELYVVEELDPFIELQTKALGIVCRGKEVIPARGELNVSIIKKAIEGSNGEIFEPVSLPARPPSMCAGCPHRGLFYCLSKLDVFVAGDIGCYTLSYLPPLSAIDSTLCMGASIGVAHGMVKALGAEGRDKVVAVIGDSTFVHSGITGLINLVHNGGYSTVIILDNRTTAMTGLQNNPVSGVDMSGRETVRLDLEKLCQALGVEHVVRVNPHEIGRNMDIIKAEIDRPAPSVVISEFPCLLLPAERQRPKDVFKVDPDKCTACGECLQLGCPAVNVARPKDITQISMELCVGCGQCAEVCEFDAIGRDEQK